MDKSIYTTFNPNMPVEQNTALRMQTISSLYGFQIETPARGLTNGSIISEETKLRISRSTFILVISLNEISEAVLNEVKLAKEKKKPIIILQSKHATPLNLNYKSAQSFVLDYANTDKTLHDISEFLRSVINQSVKEHKQSSNVGLTVIGVGLTLLALWALSSSDE
ncbi:MAG: hypothetical protein AAGC88_00685 [Bacteroidota bacterium]